MAFILVEVLWCDFNYWRSFDTFTFLRRKKTVKHISVFYVLRVSNCVKKWEIEMIWTKVTLKEELTKSYFSWFFFKCHLFHLLTTAPFEQYPRLHLPLLGRGGLSEVWLPWPWPSPSWIPTLQHQEPEVSCLPRTDQAGTRNVNTFTVCTCNIFGGSSEAVEVIQSICFQNICFKV